ncbi:MAG: quinolinate synthase NadA [Armatimonadetes bacterium]|nr:quinolinate synthase NadA [Armatimonadota bacterium]
MFQMPLPPAYRQMSEEETDRRIGEAKAALGSDLVILGHHYQRDEIIKFADFRGDSFKLSQLAAGRKDARYIVFCGVHFMAESADILSADCQKVILPNMSAGCSMADMANIHQVRACWDYLAGEIGPGIVPITYMNSTANLKDFCGRNGGAVCTSSNAPSILKWAFAQGDRVLFFPDQHLGRNTGYKMGIPLEEMVVWDPHYPDGGASPESLRQARILLWKGHCSVHQRFAVEQIEKARAERPGVHILVHPECSFDVVRASDFDGSTEYIIKKIEEAPAGSSWGVGTEINLVNRLAKEYTDKEVSCLDPTICPCSTMYRIHPSYLLWALEKLRKGEVVNQVQVPADIAAGALIALNRMLAIH